MWFDILKEDPVAASYATKRILELADDIEELGGEVEIHAPYFHGGRESKEGATLELFLEDVNGKKNPVGYIDFKDLTSWNLLESLSDERDEYEERIENAIISIGNANPVLLDALYDDYKKARAAIFEANRVNWSFTFRWHDWDVEQISRLIKKINNEGPDWRFYDPESKKYDYDSIIQLVRGFHEFIEDTGFSWGDD